MPQPAAIWRVICKSLEERPGVIAGSFVCFSCCRLFGCISVSGSLLIPAYETQKGTFLPTVMAQHCLIKQLLYKRSESVGESYQWCFSNEGTLDQPFIMELLRRFKTKLLAGRKQVLRVYTWPWKVGWWVRWRIILHSTTCFVGYIKSTYTSKQASAVGAIADKKLWQPEFKSLLDVHSWSHVSLSSHFFMSPLNYINYRQKCQKKSNLKRASPCCRTLLVVRAKSYH